MSFLPTYELDFKYSVRKHYHNEAIPIKIYACFGKHFKNVQYCCNKKEILNFSLKILISLIFSVTDESVERFVCFASVIRSPILLPAKQFFTSLNSCMNNNLFINHYLLQAENFIRQKIECSLQMKRPKSRRIHKLIKNSSLSSFRWTTRLSFHYPNSFYNFPAVFLVAFISLDHMSFPALLWKSNEAFQMMFYRVRYMFVNCYIF